MSTHAINLFIGDQIKNIREEKRISQAELAQLLKVARASITNMEAGRQTISMDKLFEICIFFKIDIESLIPSQEWFIINRNKKIKRVVTFEIVE